MTVGQQREGCRFSHRKSPSLRHEIESTSYDAPQQGACLRRTENRAKEQVDVTNRLKNSASTYLAQHAANPVDWYPWGDEPFERAAREDKPVLISIGYSACHWCHVMAHESFENEAIAALMNQNFVNIKVDREERPDVDSVYMSAVQALTGQGGWPLNVFVTPEREPFYGGTYFPNSPRMGMPSWPQVLQSIALAWRDNRTDVESNAKALLDHLSKAASLPAFQLPVSEDLITKAAAATKQYFDWTNGGFGTAPKFPNSLHLLFLLRAWARSGDSELLDMVTLSLDHMLAGGINDQIGGGFHRYSVDATWTVPHFEKMLYDNALLARVNVEAWQATKEPAYRAGAEATLDYLVRDLKSAEGLFFSSEDADSEGEEGTFYIWTPSEIQSILGQPTADLFVRAYGVSDAGNFEGRSILTRSSTPSDLGKQLGLDSSEIESRLAEGTRRLLEERSKRVRPVRDTKMLADWNCLAASALVLGGLAFGRDDYISVARGCVDRLCAEFDTIGSLNHVAGADPAGTPKFLTDYGAFIEALLDVFSATGREYYLASAERVAMQLLELFDSNDGPVRMIDFNGTELPITPTDITDGVVPSGSSAVIMALLRLGQLTDNEGLLDTARHSLHKLAPLAAQQPLSFGYLLCACDFSISPAREIVVARPPDTGLSGIDALIFGSYLPNVSKVVAIDVTSDRSLLANRVPVDAKATAYVCENFVCRLPISDEVELSELISPLLPASGRD